MADIEVLAAAVVSGRVTSLQVKMVGVVAREINRETALGWLAGGHSLIPVAGHGHATVRGAALERVEVGDAVFLRTDTLPVAEDAIQFPADGH
jgi:hypothetical protein